MGPRIMRIIALQSRKLGVGKFNPIYEGFMAVTVEGPRKEDLKYVMLGEKSLFLFNDITDALWFKEIATEVNPGRASGKIKFETWDLEKLKLSSLKVDKFTYLFAKIGEKEKKLR